MRPVVICALIYLLMMRLFEVWLSRRNATVLKARGVRFVRDDGFTLIAAVHTAWMLMIAYVEWKLGPRALSEPMLTGSALAFGIGEFARFSCIVTLKELWNLRVVRLVDAPIVPAGLYRFMRHPNYAASLISFIALPLALGQIITPLALLPWFIWAQVRRMRIENVMLALR